MRRHIGRIVARGEGAPPRRSTAAAPAPACQCTVMRCRAITAFAASAAPIT
jgi:hypothetical protein